MREQPAPRPALFQADFFEAIPRHSGNPVMIGQRTVHKRVIGIKKLMNGPIGADNMHEEKFGFSLHRIFQLGSKLGEFLTIGLSQSQTSQLKPLPSEIFNQAPGPTIPKHSFNLWAE